LAEERGGAFIDEGDASPHANEIPPLIKLLEDALAALREERERLLLERNSERTERTAAQAEASALRAERDAAQAEAATREEEVERLTQERDAERARAEEVRRQNEEERLRAAAAEAKEGELRVERDRLLREWEMAQAGRKAMEDELTSWMAGGPLGRAWRALINRRKQL
jgi:chromosome segregation ATPase